MNEARFWYPASITQITSINASFDSCILRVCYAGRNRNQTTISKEAIESAIPTMAYCPLVANYDVEAETIGGHDVGFVQAEDGLKMINLTDAIGVVPENPQWYWESVTEADGTVRDYLSTPAILWKRTPVYEKLKRDGVSGQSMEITIRDGKMVDGLFEIDAFDFTAFCLLGDGVEPCFESAQVGLFSMDKLSGRLSEMMGEFKRDFAKVMAASADDNITPNGENTMKGGESSLNIEELLQKYGLVAGDVDFDMNGMSAEEIEKRFAALKQAKFDEESGEEPGGEPGEEQGTEQGAEPGAEPGEQTGEQQGDPAGDNQSAGDQQAGDQTEGQGSGNTEGQGDGAQTEEQPGEQTGEPADDDDDGVVHESRRRFQLTGEQMWNGIMDALRTVKCVDEWGEWPRYCYADYDPAAGEVYAYDNEDWNLYGFKYTMNGDNVVIDFDSKTRKKLAYVDFDNGDAQFSYKHIMDSANARFAAVVGEVETLRAYKRNIEQAERKAKEDEVFARFADLAEDERFKQLKENCSEMSIQDIEDKCFAIRGRNVQVKFTLNNTPVRLQVERGDNDADEPYGGVFVEFGIGGRD